MRIAIDTDWLDAVGAQLPPDACWFVLRLAQYAATHARGAAVPSFVVDGYSAQLSDMEATLTAATDAGLLELRTDGSCVVRADWLAKHTEDRAQNRARQARFRDNALRNALPNAHVTRYAGKTKQPRENTEDLSRVTSRVTAGSLISDLDHEDQRETGEVTRYVTQPSRVTGTTPEQLQALWNEAADPRLKRWRAMNPARRKAALARIAELPALEDWRRVILAINAAPWCTGEAKGEHAGWMADAEFLLRPKTWPRFLDADAPEAAQQQRREMSEEEAWRIAGKVL